MGSEAFLLLLLDNVRDPVNFLLESHDLSVLLFYLVDDLPIQGRLFFDSELFFTKVLPYSRDTSLHPPGLDLSLLDLLLLVCSDLGFFSCFVEKLLQVPLLLLEFVLQLGQAIVIVLELKFYVHGIDLALEPPDLVRILDVELVFVLLVLAARLEVLRILSLLVLLYFEELGLHLIDDNKQLRPQLFIGGLYLPGFIRHLDSFDDVAWHR